MAIVDIGSNSVRLFMRGEKTTVTTRVSEGLARAGILSETAMSRTLDALRGFSAAAEAAGERLYAFGTEPLRAAANAGEFIARVRREAGFDVRVVSGEEEAELSYLGAAAGDGAVADIGGASVELVCGESGRITYIKSLPVGAVRLAESSVGDPAEMHKIIAANLPDFGKVPLKGQIRGVGGTFTSLAAMSLGLKSYDSRLVHGARLSAFAVKNIADRVLLCGGTDGILNEYPVLKRSRAEIIAAGALLASMLIEYLGADGITVSESDNLEGYALKYGVR